MANHDLTDRNTVDHQVDTLVVGGGVLGIVAAREVVAKGMSCALVGAASECVGESGHAQGLIHKGYSYLEIEKLDFSNELRNASALWEHLLPNVMREASTPVYYFRLRHLLDELEKAVQLRGGTWKAINNFSGLPLGMGANLSTEEWFAFESPEYVIRPASLWKAVAEGLEGAERIEGEWKEGKSDSGGVLSIVDTEHGEKKIRSKSIVLATGYKHLQRTNVEREGRTQDVKTLSTDGSRVYLNVVLCKSKSGSKPLEVVNCDVEDLREVEIDGKTKDVRFTILSQVDDGEVVWHITSNLLASREPDLADARERWHLLGECLEGFLPGFLCDEVEVDSCKASFALPPNGDCGISKRCMREATLGVGSGVVYAAYGERLTLATSLGELLGQQNLAGKIWRFDREREGTVVAPKYAAPRRATDTWAGYRSWGDLGDKLS